MERGHTSAAACLSVFSVLLLRMVSATYLSSRGFAFPSGGRSHAHVDAAVFGLRSLEACLGGDMDAIEGASLARFAFVRNWKSSGRFAVGRRLVRRL